MRIQLEPTDEFVAVDGVRCRAWRGATDKGTPIVAYVVCIAVGEDSPEFDGLVDHGEGPVPPSLESHFEGSSHV